MKTQEEAQSRQSGKTSDYKEHALKASIQIMEDELKRADSRKKTKSVVSESVELVLAKDWGDGKEIEEKCKDINLLDFLDSIKTGYEVRFDIYYSDKQISDADN